MIFEDMTPYALAELDEREFEAAEAIIAYKMEYGATYEQERAAWLDQCVYLVASTFGTYELDFLRAMDDCPFTQSHTRHWCGYQFCRDS